MRSGITFDVTAADRAGLEAIVANRGSPQKHAWRAKIFLMSDDGSVIGRNMHRRRHQEFIRFLNAIEAELPKDKAATSFSTTMRPTNSRRSAPGWQGIRNGPSTSFQHHVDG